MKRITMNKTTLQVSPVCLGADKFGSQTSEELSFQILDAYMYHGGNFLDTAAVYGRWMPEGENISEQIIGRWMDSRKAKNTMVIATKGGHYPLHDRNISRITKQDIENDIHDSLKALGLDVIDFYWLHRDDPSKPVGEILDMMEEFRKAGRIRYYGASNFTPARLEEAEAYAKQNGILGFSAVSNKWSPVLQNPEDSPAQDPTLVQFQRDADLDIFRTTGMAFLPYNATAGGYLEKRYAGTAGEDLCLKYQNEDNERLYRRLSEQARSTKKSIQTLLLESMIDGYGIQIIPITSVSRPEQLNAIWDLLE